MTRSFAEQLHDLAAHYGVDVVVDVAKRTIDARIALLDETSERMGYGSACHLCGRKRAEQDPAYNFALARIIEKKTNWGGALATLALNVATVPLGFVVGAKPGNTTTASLARCRLVLCNPCGERHRGFLGGLKISRTECQRHPSWNRLMSAGYDTFLDKEEAERYR